MPKIANNAAGQTAGRTHNSTLSLIIVFTVALFCAAGAAMALVVEARPLNLLTAGTNERWQMLRAEPLQVGLSMSSNRAMLDSCLAAITSVYGRMRGNEERLQVAGNCGRFAEASVAAMPSNAYAAYMASLAAAQATEKSTYEKYWLLSATTAPSEQWIAGLRVGLLEDNLPLATPELFDAERRDLAVLAMSRMGIGSIAKRYVAQRDFRERVVSVVEQLPPTDQSRFLAAVTQEANR